MQENEQKGERKAENLKIRDFKSCGFKLHDKSCIKTFSYEEEIIILIKNVALIFCNY
jgi:hypothetical protein